MRTSVRVTRLATLGFTSFVCLSSLASVVTGCRTAANAANTAGEPVARGGAGAGGEVTDIDSKVSGAERAFAEGPPPASSPASSPAATSVPAAAAPARTRDYGASASAAPMAPPPPMAAGALARHKPMLAPGMGFDGEGLRGPSAAVGGGAALEVAKDPSPPLMRAWNGPAIAAGEWDDNANYREFMRYLANEEALPLHRVDVSDRRFLVVRDADGKPVPRCRVTVGDEAQHTTSLTTMASGRAILFPHAEGLTGRSLTASARCAGSADTVKRTFAIDDQDGSVDLRMTGSRDLPATRPVDVAFILDTTGSMGEEIDAVRATIAKVGNELGHQNFRVRLGLVEYKDRGDVFVTKVHPFSTSTRAFLSDVARVNASGGGDLPESVNEGLHAGLTGLEWGQDSVARFAFLIGDAPPHLDYANDADYAVEMKRASHEGIQLFTVAASGMDALGQAVFRQVAGYTGATNLFVLRGGAGPQSTGAGDPKSSCGGTHTNYASGNLDALIVGKITHELRSMDGDAMRIAGLYKDEDAKPCNERVAMLD